MRKTSKKLLTLLLALAMMITYMPAMAFAEGEAGGSEEQSVTEVSDDAGGAAGEESAEAAEAAEAAPESQAGKAGSAVLAAKNVIAKGEGDLAITSFTVDKGSSQESPVDTGEEVTYTVECTGADGVTVYSDWWLYQQGWGDDWTEETEKIEGKVSYASSGTYTIIAEAWAEDENGDRTATVTENATVYVKATKGALTLIEPEGIPSYLVADNTDSKLEFTAAFPGNGEWMSVSIWSEGDNYRELFSKDSENKENVVVEISNDNFEEGDTIGINIYAGAAGYEASYLDYRIPVIAATSGEVEISLSDDEVLVNENTTVSVSVADGSEAEISKVQLYDGYGYWREEDPDNNGAWSRDINFGEAGTFIVFARVWLEGEEDYVVTVPKTVTVISNGECGDFDVTAFKVNDTTVDLSGNSEESPAGISRGDDISVICSESENAGNYWVDVDKYEEDEESGDIGVEENWKNYGYDQGDDPEVDFNSIELGEGLYRIRAHANSVGYERADAPTEIYIEVSDELGNEPILEG